MSNETRDNDVIAKVERRSDELRGDKKFDPRREKELNDIYNRYVPPHAHEDTSHLVDVAERDAYIDPFPPIGSQKMAGVVVKKGVRIVIGWYIQYIAQQISTFGSGVAQALRALSKDVDQLKKSSDSSDVFKYVESLELGTVNATLFKKMVSYLPDSSKRVVLSDCLPETAHKNITENIIVVDVRQDILSSLDPKLDSRKSNILEFLQSLENSSLGGIMLHGRSDFLTSSKRIELLNQARRTLGVNAPLILNVRTAIDIDNKNELIASEIAQSELWSKETWKHVLENIFTSVEIVTTKQQDKCLFVVSNG